MFESYTESARRTVHLAKYEAHQHGHRQIQPEHFLLALLKDPNLANEVMKEVSEPRAREAVLARLPKSEQLPARIDLPLSDSSHKVLHFAAKEYESLSSKHIGTEHLLFGLLKVDSFASRFLKQEGISPEAIHAKIATLERREPSASEPKMPQTPEQRFMVETIRHVQELGRKGKKRKALKFLDDLISDPKRDPRFRTMLLPLASATARSLGDLGAVRRYSEQALADNPDDAMALYALADCLADQGENKKSKEYVIKCYERSAAIGGVLGGGIIELLRKRFPEIRPSS